MNSTAPILSNTDLALTAVGDCELLRQYLQQSSAEAFAEMVRRHLNLVFSAALRRVNGDHALAQDVTQMVFADFASKARGLSPEMPIGGWLHRHTGFVAAKLTHQERRRKSREQTAATMHPPTLSPPPDQEWEATAPLLDAAMDALPASDRDAIVLRFFEQKDFRTVGAALGLSDDSAQKKVGRALEKLRADLSRRGVVSPAGALASLMALYGVSTVPKALAGEISTNALASAAVGGRSLWSTLSALSVAARWQAAALMLAAAAVAAAASRSLQKTTEEKVSVRSDVAIMPLAAVPEPPPAAITDPQKPTPTAAELVAAASAEWTASKGVASTSRALGYLSRINRQDLSAALAAAAQTANTTVRSLLKTHLLNLWAESDPRAALAWVNENPEPNRADLNQGILDTWAAKDPNAVQMNIGKSGSSSFKTATVLERVTATLFRTLAQRDLNQAFGRLNELTSPNDRGQALRGIMETVQSESERTHIFVLIDAIKSDEIRIQARRGAVEHWAGQQPEAAAAYVENAQPPWERTRLMDSLGLTWLQSDPAKAAGWWMTHAPGPDTLVKIINVWTQHNANAAGEWLRQQPTGPTSDSARMTFARQVADLDPESALRWAETVSDPTMREGTLDHVYTNWYQRDATAAENFLQKSAWPNDRISRLNTPH
jgi:RNA polymerase sigma factor (sigma-70 family)